MKVEKYLTSRKDENKAFLSSFFYLFTCHDIKKFTQN